MEAFFANTLLFGEETLNAIHPSLGSWFDYIMIAVTQTGRMPGYIVVCATLYWCFDRKIAIKIAAIVALAQMLNIFIKEIIQHPRPDPEKLIEEARLMREAVHAPGYSWPSGHAQSTTAFCMALLYYIRRKWLIAPVLLFFFLVLYSRMYLGAHFLGDLVGGIIVSLVSVAIFLALIELSQKADGTKWYPFMIGGLILGGVIVISFSEFDKINAVAGVLAGGLTGYLMCEQSLEYSTSASLARQAVKVLIGSAGAAGIYIGLTILLPSNAITSFIVNWTTGFWVSFLAPLVFLKLKLVRI